MYDGGKKFLSAIGAWRKRGQTLDRMASLIANRTGQGITAGALGRFIDHAELEALLLGDSGGASAALTEACAVDDVVLDDPDLVLAVIVSVVASCDSDLSQRLHGGLVLQRLEEIDASAGYVFGELLTELLEIRSTLDGWGRRSQALRSLVIESDEWVAQSFVALGVPVDLSRELSADLSIGRPADGVPGEVVLYRAVSGSGKSFTALRTHQLDLVDAYLDPTTPVPVFLNAPTMGGTLREQVLARSADIGDPLQAGARVVIDGLDEIDSAQSNRVLTEATVLARSWPGTQVIGFGRRLDEPPGIQVRQLETPDESDLVKLADRISGASNTFIGLSGPVREAVRLPLYAIGVAVLRRDEWDLPTSSARVIDELVKKGIKSSDSANIDLIRELAIGLTSESTVTVSDFGATKTSRVTASRLVLESNGYLRFAVPIFQVWFAADALLSGHLEQTLGLEDVWVFARWQRTLGLALALGGAADADRIASKIAEVSPGGIQLVVADATVSPYSSQRDHCPIPQDVELRTRRALEYESVALADVLQMYGPIAFDTAKTDLVYEHPRVVVTMRNGDGVELRRGASTVNTNDAAWPWRWAGGWVVSDLDSLINRQLLALEHPVLDAEAVWALARSVTDDKSLTHRPIDPSQVLNKLVSPADLPMSLPVRFSAPRNYNDRGLWMDPARYLRCLSTIEAANDAGTPLVRPWPVPDNLSSSSVWTDDFFTPPAAARFRRSVLRAALEIYSLLVDRGFDSIKAFMPVRSTFPVLIRCLYMPRSEGGMGSTEITTWHPLPVGSESDVAIAVLASPPPSVVPHSFDGADVWACTDRRVPPFEVGSSWSHGIVRGLHSNQPATNQAYRWLAADLKRLKWRVASRAPFDELG